MSKQNRIVTVITPFGDNQLVFQNLNGQEQIGRLFEFEVDMVRDLKFGNIAVDDVLGQNITVKIELENGYTRYFNGEVAQFKHLGLRNHYSCYRATLRPWLWYLTLNSNCQVFQDKSIIDIIKTVLGAYAYADVEYKLEDEYPLLDYCVQYRESDFNFISRLMEHDGVFYYFKHQKGKHTLVIADSYNACQAINGYQSIPYFPAGNKENRERDHIYEWLFEGQMTAGKYTLNDFDFKSPKADLVAKKHNPGKYLHSDQEVYDYPGKYANVAVGDKLVDKRLEEKQMPYLLKYGQGNALGLIPGMKFKLKNHYFTEENCDHVIISADYQIQGDEIVAGFGGGTEIFQCNFTAIEEQQVYRSERVTPKPVISGSQTAIVVGKQGEEIWTDQYGRVKVQFHWDRDGKADEKSSCWVRLSHPVAGKKWGWISLPRIGQEVIVSFLEGDPDQPLITGRVYNNDQMPPYDLPDKKTQSGIKTHSTKNGNADNFNEIRFEDEKGQEELYIHAEKDFMRIVENNDTLKVGFDKKSKGDQVIDIYNDRTITLEQGTDTLIIKQGDHHVKVKKGDDTLQIEMGDHLIDVSSGKSEIKAMTSIELAVGSNSIKIDQSGITIKGLQVTINGDVSVEMKSPMTTVNGDGMLTLKGGITLIN